MTIAASVLARMMKSKSIDAHKIEENDPILDVLKAKSAVTTDNTNELVATAGLFVRSQLALVLNWKGENDVFFPLLALICVNVTFSRSILFAVTVFVYFSTRTQIITTRILLILAFHNNL